MKRRLFLAALFAPYLSRLRRLMPKRQPTIVEVIEFRMNEAQRLMTVKLEEGLWNIGRSPYWHGQSPYVFINLSSPYPWEGK
jgi:hypothetical protein